MDKVEADSDTTEEPTAPVPTGPFGNDDLGRLQTILLGDHAQKTGDRIDTLEQALLGVLDDLRGDLTKRLDDLAARIDAEADTRTKGLGNVTSRLKEETASRKTAVKDLTRDLRGTEKDLNATIDSAADSLTGAIDGLRSTTEGLARTDEELGDAKVDRSALADLLATMASALDDPK